MVHFTQVLKSKVFLHGQKPLFKRNEMGYAQGQYGRLWRSMASKKSRIETGMSGSLLSEVALKRVRPGSVLWHDWLSILSFFSKNGIDS